MRLPLGQGEPLPPDFPYQGAWIVENTLFLYQPDGAQIVAGTAPRFTASGPGFGEGKVSVGIDASQLAAAFTISIDDIFAANRDGSLAITGARTLPAHPLGDNAREFVFRLAEQTRALVLTQNIDPRAT
jgi:hypothetical protein